MLLLYARILIRRLIKEWSENLMSKLKDWKIKIQSRKLLTEKQLCCKNS
jgi:hypothetical protein